MIKRYRINSNFPDSEFVGEIGTLSTENREKYATYTFHLDDGGTVPVFSGEVEEVHEIGQAVTIVRDTSSHDFAVGTTVYLLKDRGEGNWLASEDPYAAPRWHKGDTGQAAVKAIVEDDFTAGPLADWEKELLYPGSTDLALPRWPEVKVGGLVSFTIEGHGGFSAVEVGEDEDGWPTVLGISVDNIPDNWKITAYEAPKVKKPELPDYNGAMIRRKIGYNQAKAVRVAGLWLMVNSGQRAHPEDWYDGWEVV